MLRIAVCIKQIPFIEDASFDPVTRTLRRDGPAVISAFDLRAIALAMELKQRFGADTTVVTMGPPQAASALRDAIAMGMDRAVHLCDRAFAGADTLATARALAAWLAPEKYDLILLGKYTLDAETGQVGPELAELLGIAQVTGARKLEIDGAKVRAERESDEGYEEIETAMPALVTCAERIAAPLRVKPEAAEAARQTPIEVIDEARLGAGQESLGKTGSPTWVHEIRIVEAPASTCRMIDAANLQAGAAQAIAALDEMGALAEPPRTRRAIGAVLRRSVRGRDVWVACETNLAGEVTRATLELLSAGDALASQVGGALVAVGFSAAFAAHASLLAGYGADRVIALDHPLLEQYAPESAAEAFARLVRERTPWALLLCASERGRDWGPRLAARLKLGLTGDAIGLELDGERLVAMKPAFGGNVLAPIYSRTLPQMATVRPGMLELAQPAVGRAPEVETLRPTIAPALSRLAAAHSLLDPTLAPLEGATIVVGIGIGVGGAEGVARVEELAHVLGAAMCATRRVTDAGWMPRQLQVGLTGKAIDPRLYIAVGIRGAPNHTVGIKRAHTVLAINNDPEAPIFERAAVGLVADWAAIVPALTEAFRARLRQPDGAPRDPAQRRIS